MTRSAILVLAVALAALIWAPHARAEEFVCRRSLGNTTVDNVRVPNGATCTMLGTFVMGTIKVETNATLDAQDVRVIGNIQAETAAHVRVGGASQIGGSIQIVQGRSAEITAVRLTGDLLFDKNTRRLVAQRNVIGGNLQAFQNTGGVVIRRNRIAGNLQCKENNPPPTGGGNIVQGNRECARL